MPMTAEVTLLVSGESAERVFTVLADDQDMACSLALSELQSEWSIDDRINVEVELVGVLFFPF